MFQRICCCFAAKNDNKNRKERKERKERTDIKLKTDKHLTKGRQKSLKNDGFVKELKSKTDININEKDDKMDKNERERKERDEYSTESKAQKKTISPKDESFYGNPNDFNEDKKEMSEKGKDSKWDRDSVTPSELPFGDVTKTYILPYNGINTPKELMAHLGYEFHTQLGRGGFGTVRKVYKIDPKTGQKSVMACKEIIIDLIKKDRLKSLKGEIFALRKMKHPYIIELYDHFIVKSYTKSVAYIFMEFADCDTLQQEIPHLTNSTAKRYFGQIVMALVYIHRLKIAHKDLKPENILLTMNERTNLKEVRLSDFGLSQTIYKAKRGTIKSGHFGGTRAYMAPEILRVEVHRQYRNLLPLGYDPFKSDIWALGVCLYEMLTKQLPFDTSNLNSMEKCQMDKSWTLPRSVRNSIDPSAEHLLRSLLEPDVNIRIDPLGILMHPWIKDEIDLNLVKPLKQT